MKGKMGLEFYQSPKTRYEGTFEHGKEIGVLVL
jgi:hypothetical protein